MANDDKTFEWPTTKPHDETTVNGLVDCCLDTLTCLQEGTLEPMEALKMLKSDLLSIKALGN